MISTRLFGVLIIQYHSRFFSSSTGFKNISGICRSKRFPRQIRTAKRQISFADSFDPTLLPYRPIEQGKNSCSIVTLAVKCALVQARRSLYCLIDQSSRVKTPARLSRWLSNVRSCKHGAHFTALSRKKPRTLKGAWSGSLYYVLISW